jgi:peptidoglycan LD-endopeptidase CwlK
MTDLRKFSERSKAKLQGVDPRLVKVAEIALQRSPFDFGITEGLRTAERQRQLVAEGKSQTLRSRHLLGRAIDFVVLINGKANWDLENYEKVAKVFLDVGKELGIELEAGAFWKTFKDGPHIQLKDGV